MWDFFEPAERTWYRWELDGASVWLHKSGDEWRAAVDSIGFRQLASAPKPVRSGPSRRGGPATGGPFPTPKGPDLPLLITVARSRRIALRPVMPLPPFLIAANNEVAVMRGQETSFIVDLPVFLRFELESGEFIGEWRPFALSNTWFGDKEDGLLCLSIPTALDPICRDEEMDASLARPRPGSLARCTIRLRNDTKSTLDLRLLVVHAELLAVYGGAGVLSTDGILVDGLPDGGLRTSVIHEGPPPGTRLLSPARMGQSEFFMRRGANFLRAITGL